MITASVLVAIARGGDLKSFDYETFLQFGCSPYKCIIHNKKENVDKILVPSQYLLIPNQ